MKLLRFRTPLERSADRGQALVEFALVLVPFLVLLFGAIDVGRGIYAMNGTAQAAREIAREASVNCCNFSSSSEVQGTIQVQRNLIPGLQINPATDIACVDLADVVQANCLPGEHYVRVRVRAAFTPVTPIVSGVGAHTFESYSRVSIP
jgi:Flp pilus assembly protein TadG